MNRCGLKGCEAPLGPGASEIGFDNEGRDDKVRVCAEHNWAIMTAPRGTFRITPDRRLETIRAQPTIIIPKKGQKK